MKLNFKIISTVDFPGVNNKVQKAAKLAMRDTVVLIHGDAIKNARAVKFWKTGHNARSIASEVSGMGVVKKGEDAKPDKIVNDSKLEGAVYSTSGYGGYGETGTRRMPARPYFGPALKKNTPKFSKILKAKLEAPGL